MDEIILHEFLHVVQCELAGIEMTDKNELPMEFEVMLLCDVINTMITGRFVASVKSIEYMNLVSQLVRLSGHEAQMAEGYILGDFNRVYENWAKANFILEPEYCFPGALLCFLRALQ